MIFIFTLITILLSSATCRTTKNHREMAENARLSQAQLPYYNIIAPNGPGTYAFGYEIEDPATKNVQFRDEERLSNGTVIGSYGILYPDDTLQITKYIADKFGYRANTETKKKNGPLKIELQLQPTTREQPNYLASSPSPIRGHTHEYPFSHPSTSQESFPPFVDTIRPSIDPLLASQVYQQHQINLNPTFNPLRDPNILDPHIANAFLNQQYYVPQNLFLNPALRQTYDGTVSTYASQNPQQQQPWNLFGWLTGNNNNNYYQTYQDQVQTNRPVIDFITNLANNNPISSFFNQWGQNDNPNTPVLNFLNNINPLNLLNNNNNRPQTSLPITTAVQSDYIPTSPSGTTFMQPSNNIDNSVFSNDHFLNPNTFYPNTPNNNPQIVHSYYPQNQMMNQMRPQYQTYSAWPSSHMHTINNQNHHRYPINYYNSYNPYNNQLMSPAHLTYNYNRKKTNKRKKNKNKVDLDTDSDWFQGFLDKRKESSLDLNNSRRKGSSKDSDEDDDMNLDEYFR